jgi:hypothetical protein
MTSTHEQNNSKCTNACTFIQPARLSKTGLRNMTSTRVVCSGSSPRLPHVGTRRGSSYQLRSLVRYLEQISSRFTEKFMVLIITFESAGVFALGKSRLSSYCSFQTTGMKYPVYDYSRN